MLTDSLVPEHSSPEVLSRLRHNGALSPASQIPPRAIYPEPTPSAADRAAAAAAASSASQGSSQRSLRSPPPADTSTYLGPAPPPRALASAAPQAADATSRGSAWPPEARDNAERATAGQHHDAGAPAAQRGSAGRLPQSEDRAGAQARPWQGSVDASVASSMQSEPPKSTDYMSVIGMLERVRPAALLPASINRSPACVPRRAMAAAFGALTEMHSTL